MRPDRRASSVRRSVHSQFERVLDAFEDKLPKGAERLEAEDAVASVEPKDDCWDNSVAENFFSHLKTEFYHHERFATRLAARSAVMDYIESWYNRRTPNRRAGGVPPAAAHAADRTRVQESLAA